MCTVVAKLQENVTLATNWYDSNLLHGNLQNYQTMNIGNKRVNYGVKTSITVTGKDIMESDNLELQGVTIDCGLKFNLHIRNVCKKASQGIGVIMRLRNLLPTEVKLHLFKAAILPHLTYCHLEWHFCGASDTRRLERVRERGLHAVFKDKQSSYQQLSVKAKPPSLYNRTLQDICILIYKVKHHLCPRAICDMFLTNSHTYNLRQKDFYQPSFNIVTHGKHSIRYHNVGARRWSKIPSKDRSAASLKLLSNCFMMNLKLQNAAQRRFVFVDCYVVKLLSCVA